jgi:hypothetical protein
MFPTAILCSIFIYFAAITALAVEVHDSGYDNSSLVWGPYRPNLYFGVRPRIPRTLLMGLMWARVGDFQHLKRGIIDPKRLAR